MLFKVKINPKHNKNSWTSEDIKQKIRQNDRKSERKGKEKIKPLRRCAEL